MGSINDISNNSGRMLVDLERSPRLVLTVVQPRILSILLRRMQGQEWGLMVEATGVDALLVTRVIEGAVQDFNALHPNQAVRINDRITSVGQVAGSDELLLN